MKVLPLLLIILFLVSNSPAQEMVSERLAVAGEPKQEYFFIHRAGRKAPDAGNKLLIVLPGGNGSADFNPFVINISKNALGEDYVVAQLVSVKWRPDQQIIWPVKSSRVRGKKFDTEEYIEAVISDIRKTRKIDAEHIYTLSWSSGGPAAYQASLSLDEIKGSFVAMSVFYPDSLKGLKNAKGHRYYIYHSPDDRVCAYRMAEEAKEVLAKNKASVEFESYKGGHGWFGDIFGSLRKGFEWLESRGGN